MAGKTVTLTKPIERLVEKIEENFSPATVILFGSRASGENFNHSDWDLLVISKKFDLISFRDRIDKILELIDGPVGQDVEPLCYTPAEIEKRKNELGIIKKALETGIVLSSKI